MTAIAPETIEFPTPFTRAREGDHDAFAQLIERHEAMVYSLAWNFFGDRSRAEEIAQDVFLQLYRNLHTIESDSHLLFWLRQVTTRRCIDLARRARLKAVSLEDAGELSAETRPRDPFLDRRLKRLVEQLPDVQRAVVTLRYQEDLDPSEICRIVGMPVNTVKSHLHRALQALRRKLENRP
ncbi:MAG TPA: RNA polymerase sigma factor [Thermoanaerobaculia bacterium]|jgi:RNA polymerase sigma-70 factor (ECF subfamily)|nr:RNA polymerase sigma factor [Thermoanaerobaculia bacterium]